MPGLRFLPPAAKYFKKLKDKHLKKIFQDAVDAILENPMIGEEKHGDLRGIRSYDIYRNAQEGFHLFRWEMNCAKLS